MDATTYIGGTIALVMATPATFNQAGYEALTFVELGKVINASELGDEAEDISFNLLKSGRTSHLNGVKNNGATVTFVYDRDDAGYALVKANANGNTLASIEITDPDGDVTYFQCVLANLRDATRDASSVKAKTVELRVTTDTVLVEGS